MSTPKETRSLIFYPIFFGIYPVLALAASNIEQTSPLVAVRATVVSLIGSLLVYLLLCLITKKQELAALVSSVLMLSFFSYGHVYGLIEGKQIFGFDVGRHRFMIVLWLVLTVLCLWLVIKKWKPSLNLARLLNVVSIFLLILPMIQMGIFAVHYYQINSGAAPTNIADSPQENGQELPDVYYIILDGYTRSDKLLSDFEHDNSGFKKQMEDMGFIFPACAMTNYTRTALSLSSSLNMNYVEAYTGFQPDKTTSLDFVAYAEFIRHSQVRQELEALGYKTVAFDTAFWFTEIPDADLVIRSQDNPLEKNSQKTDINSFEMLFLRTTAIRIATEAQSAFLDKLSPVIRIPEQAYYDRTMFALEQLERLPGQPGHKFVFAHLIAPHAPFVFDPDGTFHFTEGAMPGYPNEVTYLNQRILEITKNLIKNSKVPPIIIIQGDHGWDPENRNEILNAYYLPNGGSKMIYDTITPVNTFRVILNYYFGKQYQLLEDVSRYSTAAAPYDFKVVPATCEPQP